MTPDMIVAQRMRGLALSEQRERAAGEVVRDLLAMQSQEHRYARWSVAQRSATVRSAADVDAAFDAGEVLRTHVLRPTWHYVAPVDLRWLLALSGPVVTARNALRYEHLELDLRTRQQANELLAGAVADGPRTRAELAAVLERRRISTTGQRLPHLLMHAELHAVLCSGPMRGKQHTYVAFDDRVPASAPRERDEALAELAQRYFATRGPATARDFRWWAGLAAADGRVAIDGAGLECFALDGRTYWCSGDAPKRPPRQADLVQCYDECIVSYTESRDLLSADGSVLGAGRSDAGFQHVVLLDGRMIGRWRVRSDGSVETRLEGVLDAGGSRAVAAAAERYERFTGEPSR